MPSTIESNESRRTVPPRPVWALPSIVAFVLVIVAIVAVACGGGDSDDDPPTPNPEDDDPTPIVSTFTPTAEGDISTLEKTQTAAVLTATAIGPLPTATLDPNPGTATPLPPDALRPPDCVLITSAGQAPGAIGSYNWYDAEKNQGAKIDAVAGVELPNAGVIWTTGETGRITCPVRPYDIIGSDVSIYTAEGNLGNQTDQQGRPTGKIVFFPQLSPVAQFSLPAGEPQFTHDVPTGRYIVSVQINWQPPEAFPDLVYTQYIYIVDVP